jgi:peroxiredoxin
MRIIITLAGVTVALGGFMTLLIPGDERVPRTIAFLSIADDYEAPEQPGLEVGSEAPTLALQNEVGKKIDLADLYAKGPVVLTFYRGGWCPYCTKALSQWQTKLSTLSEVGGTFVAITPEKPTYIASTKDQRNLEYTVLSDADAEAGRAFKVQFTLDDETIEKYKGYGIDLTEHNANGEWTLPAPATFVIDTDGVIRWVFADWDYSKRADPDEVIRAVRKLIDRR